jgi:hypothetical protein
MKTRKNVALYALLMAACCMNSGIAGAGRLAKEARSRLNTHLRQAAVTKRGMRKIDNNPPKPSAWMQTPAYYKQVSQPKEGAFPEIKLPGQDIADATRIKNMQAKMSEILKHVQMTVACAWSRASLLLHRAIDFYYQIGK